MIGPAGTFAAPKAMDDADRRDPEMCIHALSVNEDRDLLCCKGSRRRMCDGPCADFVNAFGDDEETPNVHISGEP